MLTRYDRIQGARERQLAREAAHPAHDLFDGVVVTASKPKPVEIPAGYAHHHNARREMVRRSGSCYSS